MTILSQSLTNLCWASVSPPQNAVNGLHYLGLEGRLLVGKVAGTELNESLDGLAGNGNVLVSEGFDDDLQQDGYLTDKVHTLEMKQEMKLMKA